MCVCVDVVVQVMYCANRQHGEDFFLCLCGALRPDATFPQLRNYGMTKIFPWMLSAAAASSVLLLLKIIHSQLIALSILAPLHADLHTISYYVRVWSEGG